MPNSAESFLINPGRSPKKTVAILTLLIAAAEAFSMLAVRSITMHFSYATEIVIDITILVALLSPALYFLIFKTAKQTSEALESSKKRFRELTDQAPFVFELYDKDGLQIDVNPAYEKLWEISKETTINSFNVLESKQLEAAGTTEYVNRAFAGESVQLPEYKWDPNLEVGQGRSRWLKTRIYPLKNQTGDVTNVVIIHEDITERKQTEEALRISEEMLEESSRLAKVGGWEIDLQGNTLIWTEETFRIFELDNDLPPNVDEAIQFYHPNDQTKVTEAVQRTVNFGETFDFEARLITAKKNQRWVRAVGKALFKEGSPATVRGMVQDITEHKQAEEALQESERRFHGAFDTAAHGMALVSPDGRWLSVNQSLCDIVGYTEEELLKTDFQTITHVEDLHSDLEYMNQLLADEISAYNMEKRYIHKDGYNVWIYLSVSLVRDSKGKPLHFVSQIQDITERKQAFDEVKKISERMQLAADSAQFGIWDLDIKGKRFEWDDWMFRLYGISKDNFNSSPEAWQASVHPDDLERISKEIDQAVKGLRKFDTEFRIIRPDGEVRCLKAYGNITRDSNGELSKMTGINYDITEQKKNQEALIDSKKRYETIIQTAVDGFWVTDDKANLLQVNDAYCKMSGYSEKELLSMSVYDIEINDPEEIEKMTQTIIKNGFVRFEAKHRRKDGSVFDVDVALQSHPGTRDVFFSFNRDITERKRLESELQQSQKMESVGRLAGGVAHDFNNMLSVILGNTEIALEDIDPRQPIHSNLKEIKEAAKRSADVTRQLLAFARKQTIAPQVIDLNEVIGNILKMLRRLIGENIDLLWFSGKQLWPVKMDPSQLDQILTNLSVNARDAFNGTGKLTIETCNIIIDRSYCDNHPGFTAGDFVQLTVSDNGCGMDQENMKNLFEPFFTTKAVDKGTGLGLATVYGIVKQNKGFINVYSEPNKGTTFKIYLPRHTVSGKKIHAQEKTEVVLHGSETILLVEDEVSILKMTKQMLKRMGYTVLSAIKPEEAIKIAREHKGEIHLLLTDVVMPEMNGQELLKMLLLTHPNLKSLFMSGYTANVIAHHGILDEGVNYIQKPFSRQGLSVKLREVLEETKG